MESIFLFVVSPKICFSTSTFQDFCSDMFCSYLQRTFRKFTNFCFSENLLLAPANRFKVLKISISLKVTVYTQYRRRVLNGNLIVLKWQNIHMISNIKWRERERETERHLVKQFTLHTVETYSEPFPTSKQGGCLTAGNYFDKNIHPRCLKRF